jgi:hypothetical protein
VQWQGCGSLGHASDVVGEFKSAARYRREGYTIRAGRNLICLMLFLVGARISLIRWVYGA